MDLALDPSASKQVAMTSLDWCARSRQLNLLNAVLSTHFANSSISELERECGVILRHAVTSGCKDTFLSLLRHVDDAFLRQCPSTEGDDDVTDGRTRLEKLLGLAVEQGNGEVAEVLLSKGANADGWYRGKPYLHLSLSLGQPVMASLLLGHRAKVNSVDSKGETPIFLAVSSDSEHMYDVIDELIRHGADVNHRSVAGRQPIHCAAAASNPAAIARLVEAGCDVSARDGVRGDTPLHVACTRCCQESVTSLIRHGADFNALNDLGETPLRKLLQHATRLARDFHQDSRIRLARVLVALGFGLGKPPGQREGNSADSLSLGRKASLPCLRTQEASCSDAPSFTAWALERERGGTGTSLQLGRSSSQSLLGSRSPSSPAPGGRDKVVGTFRTLARSDRRGVAGLQHLCRLEVRRQLPPVGFQAAVRRLELSPQMRQYLVFKPRLVDETVLG